MMLRSTVRSVAGFVAAGATIVALVGAAPSGGAGPAGPGNTASADARVAGVTSPLPPASRFVSVVINPVSGQRMYHPVNTTGPGI
jgi:hypothetical protein